jgi:serine/threonine protein kinase
MTTNFPDFSPYGYQVLERLNGSNISAGRVTYRARAIATQTEVVIKEFQFVTTGSSDSRMSGWNAIDREESILEELQHPRIPQYRGRFEPESSICIVQDYCYAKSLEDCLSAKRLFEPEQIKTIAVGVLEILVYLQETFVHPVFHLDLKPSNILIDTQCNPYLVDFGTVKRGEGTRSTFFGGTPGFMAPEQFRAQKVTTSTDLYALGATIICLLTQTPSHLIGEDFIDEDGRIQFADRLPEISERFINWLKKIVEPKLRDRYRTAKEALEAVESLYVRRYPEVSLVYEGKKYKISQGERSPDIVFQAERLYEKMTQEIILTNSVSETVLKGKWQVAPHPSDPPHTSDSHAWVSFHMTRFEGNQVRTKISIDTEKLMAAKVYERQILLKTNSLQEFQKILLRVRTAPIPKTVNYPNFRLMIILTVVCLVLPLNVHLSIQFATQPLSIRIWSGLIDSISQLTEEWKSFLP